MAVHCDICNVHVGAGLIFIYQCLVSGNSLYAWHYASVVYESCAYVSVRQTIHLLQAGIVPKRLNVGSRKQPPIFRYISKTLQGRT